MSQKSPPPTIPPPIPGPLRWATWLLFAEAAVMVVATLILLYEAIAGAPVDRRWAFALVGLAVLAAAALCGLAVALRRRAPRALAPAIVLQLIAVMIGIVQITSGPAWYGVPPALTGITVVTLLLTPGTARALGFRDANGAR